MTELHRLTGAKLAQKEKRREPGKNVAQGLKRASACSVVIPRSMQIKPILHARQGGSTKQGLCARFPHGIPFSKTSPSFFTVKAFIVLSELVMVE